MPISASILLTWTDWRWKDRTSKIEQGMGTIFNTIHRTRTWVPLHAYLISLSEHIAMIAMLYMMSLMKMCKQKGFHMMIMMINKSNCNNPMKGALQERMNTMKRMNNPLEALHVKTYIIANVQYNSSEGDASENKASWSTLMDNINQGLA